MTGFKIGSSKDFHGEPKNASEIIDMLKTYIVRETTKPIRGAFRWFRHGCSDVTQHWFGAWRTRGVASNSEPDFCRFQPLVVGQLHCRIGLLLFDSHVYCLKNSQGVA